MNSDPRSDDPTPTNSTSVDPPPEDPTPIGAAMQLFATQSHVASDLQLRSVGISHRRQQTMIRLGLWHRYSPGVIAIAGVTPTWKHRAAAATLSPGARLIALAAGPAGRMHQIDGCLAVDDVKVVVANSATPRTAPDVTVLRSRRLTEDDTMIVEGIRVTTVAVTLLHLQVHGPNAEKALDDVLRKGQDVDELRTTFERWQGYGVAGPRAMLEMLHDRVDARLPLSFFQRLASRLLVDVGLIFVDEWPVLDEHGRPIAHLDLACVELRVGVECQSWEHHGSPDARRRDTERKRTLRALGWDIVELWWSDLQRMDGVIADIRISLERARLLQAAASARGIAPL